MIKVEFRFLFDYNDFKVRFMKFFIKAEDIKNIIKSKQACIVSNKILIDGKKVGYMYREEPSKNFNDSGWRFFAGDEDDGYCENSENFNIVELNTLANYDADTIKLLDAEVGASFEKDNGGKFKEIKK